jgi:hypothetical protein
MALYCCYCGALFVSTGKSCEFCNRKIVKQPSNKDGEISDGEEEDEDERQQQSDDNNNNDELLISFDDSGTPKHKRSPTKIKRKSTTGSSASTVSTMTGLSNFQSPPDHQDMIYGFVERFRGTNVHTFHFCREADGSFILAASMSATGEGPVFFHTRAELTGDDITMNNIPRRPGQTGYVACLIPTSILGTEYIITTKEESSWIEKLLKSVGSIKRQPKEQGDNDTFKAFSPKPISNTNGHTTDDRKPSPSPQDITGRELGLFLFDANLLGSAPNTVKATVRANPSSEYAVGPIKAKLAKRNASRYASDQSLFERLRGKRDRSYRPIGQDEEDDDEIATFETRKPQWSQAVGGWTLDFK